MRSLAWLGAVLGPHASPWLGVVPGPGRIRCLGWAWRGARSWLCGLGGLWGAHLGASV